jgi:glycosyltransferase involved in cell wall biosynthesis
MMPFISVITICFNNLQETIATCQSVDIQSREPYEHIIIDGSTSPVIKNYLEQTKGPAYRKWISEPDNGIADAFNKGLLLAQGDVVVMLNSGDTFFDTSSIETVTKVFEAYPSIQWLHGKYQLIRGGQHVIIGKPFERSKLYRGMRSICHQTMFLKKELHSKYGLYDTAEKIGMDYDLLCRIAGEPFMFVSSPLVKYAPAGTSSVLYLKSLEDAKRIYEKYYGKSLKLWFWQLRLKFLFYLLRSPVGNFLYRIKTKMKLENM